MTVVIYEHGKPQIKRVEAFCILRDKKLLSNDELFSETLNHLDKMIKEGHPKVTQNALNNCHGDWYEWMLACSAWNLRINSNKKAIALLLLNISRFDVVSLYTDNLYNHISDLRQKVKSITNVHLITSNPDFVIIDPDGIELDQSFDHLITEFTTDTIQILEESYRYFIGKCLFENIIGYLSIKTSLRPDRRLQIAHEGSLMKATYIHLQTREWIINPRGLKYYAASTEVGDADRNALKTVATHSITNVQSLPQAAVDEVFVINSLIQANQAFDKILSV